MMENELNELEYAASFPSLGIVSATSHSSVVEEECAVQITTSPLPTSSDDTSHAVERKKPRKILRKLKAVLRKEVKDELREELKKLQNLEDKADRANTQFKVKVFQTLKAAAIRDQTVAINLERVRHDRVEKKIQAKYDKCQAKMIAEIERQKVDEERAERKLVQRRNNMQQRMERYSKQWKYMDTLKHYYRGQIRKEMEQMKRCRRRPNVRQPDELQVIVDFYDQRPVKNAQTISQSAPTVQGDMLKLVLHMIARRVVHGAVSRLLCYLLTGAEKCILKMSPDVIKKLNRYGNEMCSDNVENELRIATERYVPAHPPSGFLANLLKTFSPKPKARKAKPCPKSQTKLKCPCEESTPEPTEVSVESSAPDIPTPQEKSISTRPSSSSFSMGTTWSNSSDSSIELPFDKSPPPTATRLSPIHLKRESPQSSTSTSACDSSVLLPSDDSIQYYFEKYNINHIEDCGCKPNRTKYLVQNPEMCPTRSIEKILGLLSNEVDAKGSLCFQLMTNRQPLNSNNLYELLHKENSAEEDGEDLCNSEIVVEKVKVPEKLSPIRFQTKLKPNILNKSTKPKEKKALKPQAPLYVTDDSDIFESSELNVGPLYWLYNSLRFLSTKLLDVLCKLLTTSRPPHNFQFRRFEKLSKMEDFEDLLCSLFEENFDVVNNESLVFFTEKFFYFVWLTSHQCRAGDILRPQELFE